MKLQQAPHCIVMVQPKAFGYNAATADSNSFQIMPADDPKEIQKKGLEEFNAMVALLESFDIDIRVFQDTTSPPKPDVLFTNNWVSFHEDGKVILYPMMAESRRQERRTDILDQLRNDFDIQEVIDLSEEEKNNRFLEGTGSLVFDYVNRKAYACRSPRTNDELVEKVCKVLHYKPVLFDAVDQRGKAIYHTNVLMFVGSKVAVVCLDAIRSESDQDILLDSFLETGHKVVAISFEQMNAFAGNMIEVKSRSGEPILLLSKSAFNSLLPGQVDALSRHTEMIPIPIDTIERCGGGSVRCMVAGIYLPLRNSI